MTADIPLIDLRVHDAAEAIDAACRAHGFFVITGHGVDPVLFRDLHAASTSFFARRPEEKAQIAMSEAGRAWRGWFPPGGELTSGVPDGKEGIYFGAELGPSDPRVAAGLPMHGRNLFPTTPATMRPLVLEALDTLTALAQRVLGLMAVGLGLDEDWFVDHVTADPTVLFRIFHYPPDGEVGEARWGVAEHTDYGLVTILHQDDVGGLEVRTGTTWTAVPPVDDSFVCNLGDMLERLTGGRYRSTPHRVRRPDRSRLSFPFFLDPSWDWPVDVAPGFEVSDAQAPARWDGRSVFAFDGTYGDYLTAKVARVFPHLAE